LRGIYFTNKIMSALKYVPYFFTKTKRKIKTTSALDVNSPVINAHQGKSVFHATIHFFIMVYAL
jgi:hypothetical protein